MTNETRTQLIRGWAAVMTPGEEVTKRSLGPAAHGRETPHATGGAGWPPGRVAKERGDEPLRYLPEGATPSGAGSNMLARSSRTQ